MRKHKIVVIAAEGRDNGKAFMVLEKSAYDAEKWAARALLALSRAGVEVSEDAFAAGMIGILATGMAAFQKLAFEEAEPLLDEMMPCIWFVPDPAKLDPATGRPFVRSLVQPSDLGDGDIEEVATMLTLRSEVLELHLGFSITAALSTMAAAIASSRQASSTSPKAAGRSSRRAKRA